MTDVKDLLKRYSLKEKVVKKWAAENFPEYQDNLRMMISMYLEETEGLKLDPFELGMVEAKEAVDVKDLELNVFSQIQVLIANKISEFEYQACEECGKKVNEDGECKVHGQVSSNLVAWRKFIAGDKTGDVVFTLPPTTTYGGEMLRKTFRAEGSIRDRGEFVVRSLFEVKKDGDAKSPPKKAKASSEDSDDDDVDVDVNELDDFKTFVNIYGGVPEKVLKAWHKSKEMSGSFEDLMTASELELRDGKLYVPE